MHSATALFNRPAVIAAPVPVLVMLARLLRRLSDALVPAVSGSPSACCGEILRPAPREPGFLYCSTCGGMILPAAVTR